MLILGEIVNTNYDLVLYHISGIEDQWVTDQT